LLRGHRSVAAQRQLLGLARASNRAML
jgi:hypothetical protein